MPFTGKPGDSIYLKDTGGHHRYVILSHSDEDGNVIVVNFTSARYWKEWIVTFTPRDNRKLFTHKTTVNYADARIVPVDDLKRRLVDLVVCDYIFCPENLLRKIVIGAFQSQFTPIEVLNKLETQYPIEYESSHEKDY